MAGIRNNILETLAIGAIGIEKAAKFEAALELEKRACDAVVPEVVNNLLSANVGLGPMDKAACVEALSTREGVLHVLNNILRDHIKSAATRMGEPANLDGQPTGQQKRASSRPGYSGWGRRSDEGPAEEAFRLGVARLGQ